MVKKLFIFISIAIFCGINLYAQTEDMELWAEVVITKKINERLKVSLEEEIRFNENISSIKKIYTDIGITYKLYSHIRFSIYYRHIQKREINAHYSLRHRFYADAIIVEKYQRLRMVCRSRFQTKYVDMFRSDNGLVPANYFREKIGLSYDIRNSSLEPKLSAEVYIALNGVYRFQSTKYRVKAGLEYNLNKKNSIDIYYRLQRDIHIPNPLNSYIIGLSYSYNL